MAIYTPATCFGLTIGVGVGLQPTPAPGDRGEPPFTPDAKHSKWAAACSPFYVLCYLKLNFSSEDKAGSRANTARESLSEKSLGPLYGQENRWEEITGLHNVQQPVSGAGKHFTPSPLPLAAPLPQPTCARKPPPRPALQRPGSSSEKERCSRMESMFAGLSGRRTQKTPFLGFLGWEPESAPRAPPRNRTCAWLSSAHLGFPPLWAMSYVYVTLNTKNVCKYILNLFIGLL